MSKTFDVNDILNTDWLRNENVSLRIEESNKIPIRTFFIAKLLKRQLPDYKKADVVNFLLLTLYNVERRTIYTWYSSDFDPMKVYPAFYKKHQSRQPKSGLERFVVQVITREKKPKELGRVELCLDALETVSFRQVETNKPKLNITNIIDKRETFLEKAPPVNYDIKTMEELVVKLCEDFATGLITITEACERNGMTYIQFIEVITTSEYCRVIYEKAVRYANMLQNSRQLTLVDNMIIQLLASGQHVTETTTFEKIIVPGQLEPKWIEKRKQRTVKQILPNELITMKLMLLKSYMVSSLEQGGEFGTYTEAELMDYIAKNNVELQKMLSQNPTINIGEAIQEN